LVCFCCLHARTHAISVMVLSGHDCRTVHAANENQKLSQAVKLDQIA
jgi:hypothetical protein